MSRRFAKHGLYRQIRQSLPYFRICAVWGDGGPAHLCPHYVVIRAVNSVDAMTADWVRLPYEVLEAISSRIVSEIKDINRVVYDITSKPPATIEWE